MASWRALTIHLDTSVLIDVLTGTRPLLAAYESATAGGHRIGISTIALYEWLRGPRNELEIRLQRDLCPEDRIVPFGSVEAALAASLYRKIKSGRGREADIAIAACAIEHGATIWTVNTGHFQDIPGLRLYQPKPGTAHKKS